MIEYHTLKLESKNDYNTNNATYALASFLSNYYEVDNLISVNFIKKHINNTTDPIEFLRKIENGID